jgi:hypothetical protein
MSLIQKYITVKLDLNKQQTILFVITRIHYNRDGLCSKHGFGTQQMNLFCFLRPRVCLKQGPVL